MSDQFKPSGLEALRFESELQYRIQTFVVLETARREICSYTADPCDCKYGARHPRRPGTEATGCPELRDLIRTLTGWPVFSRGGFQSPEELAQILADTTRDAWLAEYSNKVRDFATRGG